MRSSAIQRERTTERKSRFPHELEEILDKLQRNKVGKDFSNPLYSQAHPLILKELDHLRELIGTNHHHDDFRCYFHIFDYFYLLRWLTKEERREYMNL